MTIIENTITRNREFQKERQERVKKLKELKAPIELIEYEEKIAKMTIAEYNIHLLEIENERKKENMEYAKTHPIKKEIVDKIYELADRLEFHPITYGSRISFLNTIHPLAFMSKEDFRYDLYQTFLDHAIELYREKFKKQYDEIYNKPRQDESNNLTDKDAVDPL